MKKNLGRSSVILASCKNIFTLNAAEIVFQWNWRDLKVEFWCAPHSTNTVNMDSYSQAINQRCSMEHIWRSGYRRPLRRLSYVSQQKCNGHVAPQPDCALTSKSFNCIGSPRMYWSGLHSRSPEAPSPTFQIRQHTGDQNHLCKDGGAN